MRAWPGWGSWWIGHCESWLEDDAGAVQPEAGRTGLRRKILREPLGFQPRNALLTVLDASRKRSRNSVVHVLTGMAGFITR